MDAAGIDIAVLSTSRCNTLEECIIADDALGKIMKEYPDRFVGLARCIPTLGDESLKELDRAINELGLKGVCIDAQIEAHNLDAEILWPFYKKVSPLDVPIFVHIGGTREGFEAYNAKDSPYSLQPSLGVMALDQSATVRIILGGVLAKYPDLKFVIAHMGGGIAAIKDRVVMNLDHFGSRVWGMPGGTPLGGTPPFEEPYGENFTKYFNMLYFDMAGYEGRMNAVQCALVTIDPERLLFATDYPANFSDAQKVREYIENIRKLDLPAESIELMLGGTAAKLLNL